MRISRISGMVAGLLVTFVGQTFGHDVDPADSCSGYDCSTPGQQCGPGVQGAYNDAYVCSEEKQWIRVPSTWKEDPSLFALLFHGHDHDEVEGLFNSSENGRMYTQEEYDAATDGMFWPTSYELATANCSDVQTYLNAYDDVSIYNHDHCGRTGIRLSTAWQSDEKDLYDVTCSSLTTYFNNYDAVSHHYKVNCGMTVPGGEKRCVGGTKGRVGREINGVKEYPCQFLWDLHKSCTE